MTGSLVRRLINVTVDLNPGDGSTNLNPTFSGTDANRVTVSGLRVSAQVNSAGAPLSQATIKIFGLTESLMNQLTQIGMTAPQAQARKISVTVQAGDAAAGLGTVFTGTLYQAWADYQNMPDVVFHILATGGRIDLMKPVPPLSYKGSADIVTIIQNIAGVLGYAFENHGVEGVKLSNPYYPGTAMEQALSAADDAGVNLIVEGRVLILTPKGQPRNGAVPLISAETGMIGYPSRTGNGVLVRTLYNPSIKFGGKIKVRSDIPSANGEWVTTTLDHHLESETPGGAWMTQVSANVPGAGPVLR